MRLQIDTERCIGSGQCELTAPHTFMVNDGGFSEVMDPAGDPHERVEQAIRSCPTAAISAVEDRAS